MMSRPSNGRSPTQGWCEEAMRARAGWLQLSQLRLAASRGPPRADVNLGALSCTLPTLQGGSAHCQPGERNRAAMRGRVRRCGRRQATGRRVQGDLHYCKISCARSERRYEHPIFPGLSFVGDRKDTPRRPSTASLMSARAVRKTAAKVARKRTQATEIIGTRKLVRAPETPRYRRGKAEPAISSAFRPAQSSWRIRDRPRA